MAVTINNMCIVDISAIFVNTVEPLYCGHHGDLVKCPVEESVFILGVNFN